MKLKNKLDEKYWKICKYVLLTAAILLVMIFIFGKLDIIGSALGHGLAWIGSILKPVVFGAVIAYLFWPIVKFYERKLPAKINSHSAAVGFTILTVVVVLAVILAIIILALTKQISSLSQGGGAALMENLTDQLQSFYDDLTSWLRSLNVSDSSISEWEASLISWLENAVNSIGSNAGNILNNIKEGASTTMFAIMFSVYFLFDASRLKQYWGNVIRKVWSQKVNTFLWQLYKDIDTAFSGYFRGQGLDALFMATVISVSFSIAGVPYGVLIGIMTGLGNLIPYVGPVFGYGLTILSGLVTGNMKAMIIGIIIVAVIQGVDGSIVNPRLLSKSIEIHPMLVLVALIAGGKIGGVVGMLVAVPTAALLKIWFERYISSLPDKKTVQTLPEQSSDQ
ncbi:MAG: AI-2E family transporter [Bulleidia sp.]|nr:AI-2E family transporter [Bulleidia sp.]